MVTTSNMRANGLTYGKMPLFVWSSAPCEVTCLSRYKANIFTHSWEKLQYNIFLCVSLVITYLLSNKYKYGQADINRLSGVKLNNPADQPKELFYGEDNKLDTLKLYTTILYSQFSCNPNIWSNLINNVDLINNTQPRSDWLKLKYLNNLKVNKLMQAPKKQMAINVNMLQPRFETTSILKQSMWERRFRSSNWYMQSIAKGTSLKQVSFRIYRYISTFQKITKRKTLTAILMNELNKYVENDKIINLNGLLGDPYFWIAAYDSINRKSGNMTKGDSNETLDGINFEYFDKGTGDPQSGSPGEKLAKDIISGDYKPGLARVKEIPKANSTKTRSLTISNPKDKIVQAGLASILEALWEPEFKDTSHGFRPNKSTHSALQYLRIQGSRYKWVVQGDISKCFDMIPHSIIRERIKDKIVCHNTIALLSLGGPAKLAPPRFHVIGGIT